MFQIETQNFNAFTSEKRVNLYLVKSSPKSVSEQLSQSAEYGRYTREFLKKFIRKKFIRNKGLKTALHARDLVEFCHTLFF